MGYFYEHTNTYLPGISSSLNLVFKTSSDQVKLIIISVTNLKEGGKRLFTNYVDKILACFDHLPPALTFTMVWTLTKRGHFWTTYLSHLVNLVCEWPLKVLHCMYAKYLAFIEGCIEYFLEIDNWIKPW